jgi:uncharacterized protein
MATSDPVTQTQEFLKQKFAEEVTGHDYWHMYRVWRTAKYIAEREQGVDVLTLELAALLHDIADWKFTDGDDEAGPREARKWLESIGVDEAVIRHVEEIIRHVSFKGAGVKSKLTTIEGKIVHDADKLDAIGAIGIARTFAYGGSRNRPLYDPDVKPVLHGTFEEYRKSTGPTLNHFYEKLLLLKDMMFTETGRKMAEQRHKFMQEYLHEFYVEWDGTQ